MTNASGGSGDLDAEGAAITEMTDDPIGQVVRADVNPPDPCIVEPPDHSLHERPPADRQHGLGELLGEGPEPFPAAPGHDQRA